jgi:hypothetical protein
MNLQLWTFKTKDGNVCFEYLLRTQNGQKPTILDFKAKYRELFYIPFHMDEEIIELTEKL